MKYTIWSSDINIEDWKDFLEEEDLLEADEYEQYDAIYELNEEYLYDELDNINMDFNEGLIVFGDVGRWNGRSSGILYDDHTNLKECIQDIMNNSDCRDFDIYIDDEDLTIKGTHHDGTNYYIIRRWLSDVDRDKTRELLENGEIRTDKVLELETAPIGNKIKEVLWL